MLDWPLRIAGLGHALPARRVDNATLAARLGPEVDPAAILRAAGVSTRYHVDTDTESAVSLGVRAATEALAEAGLGEVDLLINASGTQARAIPDGSALLLRALAEAGVAIPTGFSVHSTCLSFLSALQVGGALLAAGTHRRILVISTEAASVGLDPADLETAALIGDGAAAAVLERSEGDSRLEALHFETFPAGTELTTVRGGGTEFHPLAAHTQPRDHTFQMSGRPLIRLVLRELPGFLSRAGIDLDSVDHLVPHQASPATFSVLARMGLGDTGVPRTVPRMRVHRTLAELGNTVAASIPLTLHHAVRAGAIARGERVLLLGSGAGVTLGAALLRY